MSRVDHATAMLSTARIVERLAAALPAARNHLITQIRLINGRNTATVGAATFGSPGDRTITVLITDDNHQPILDDHGQQQYDQVPVTAVEHHVYKRDRIITQLDYLDGEAAALTQLATNLLTECETLTGTKTKPDRCDATALPGYLEPRPPQGEGWSDLTCHDAPIRGTLCGRCYHRYRRYRIDHGHPDPLTETH
jgi:hypothetical protein